MQILNISVIYIYIYIYQYFPIFLPLKWKKKNSSGDMCIWSYSHLKLAPDPIEIGKINYQLWMQIMYYIELWGQSLDVIVITWVNIFQKKPISELRPFSQIKNHCPKPQQNQFSLIFDINFQVPPWVPPIKVMFVLKNFKSSFRNNH